MKVSKTMKFFGGVLLLGAFLWPWNPPAVSAFAPAGGGEGLAAEGRTGISGKVVETMDSGGYTYALVDKDGVKTWVALPISKIAVGGEIACRPGAVMNDFSSPSLKRTFESIVFSPGLVSAGVAAAPAPTKIPASAKSIPVGKAEGANAYNIAEIFEKKDGLANTPVTVKARVVKVSLGIMGKNWLHLQDGTGSPATRTNDLVVTTDARPGLGDVVTVKGSLSLNRDFGAGYLYNVIIEGAEVIVGR